MVKRIALIVMLVVGSSVLTTVFKPYEYLPALAQGNCRSFPETSKQVCGRFLEYWTQNGGLAQQGLPLSGEFSEVSDLNGLLYTVQYFERAVFEKHPEFTRPNDVLLSQLGTTQFKAKYQGVDPAPVIPPQSEPPPPPAPTIAPPPATQRCGAICNDGTRSTATGRGACSQHGGVREWLYC